MLRTAFLALLVAFPAVAAANDKLVIDINRPTATKVSVAVPVLLTGAGVEEPVAKQAADLMNRNLQFSGVFAPINTAPWTAQARRETLDAPAYNTWRLANANTLVRGHIERSGGGYVVEFQYYDTVQEKSMLGRKYTVGSDIAPAVHAFSNALMELVTQRTGPFGSRIVFEYRQPNSTRKDLWVIDLDGTNLQPVTRNNMLNLSPVFSRDGRYIAYTSYKRRNPDLYIMNVVTGSDEVLSARAGHNMGAAFSPDGRYVAASLSFEGNSELYLLSLQGEIVRRLTNNQAIDIQPAFSPDGKQIAFVSDRVGNPQLYVMNADGSGQRRLTHEGRYNTSPAWSPTGEWIAYASRDDRNIWMIRPDGREARRLTNGEGMNDEPSWSPDGRYVVFSSNRGGSYDLWAVDTISGTTTRITELPGDTRNPSWGVSFKQ
jgi:TolB protein